MTPNGAVIFTVLIIAAAMAANLRGLALVCAVAAAFAAVEAGTAALLGLRRAVLLMLPLAAFMIVIWVGIVGRSPADIADGLPGSRVTALGYVAAVSVRLFLIVFVLQAVTLCFRNETPFTVVRALHAPLGVKRMMVLVLSLIETLRHAVGRSHTALVASGVITRTVSVRNFLNGWILIQTVWLTAITTVVGRLRDKWPTENTLARLDPALTSQPRRLGTADLAWIAAALLAFVLVLADRVHGAV
jgi:hypothetical protein